MPRLKSRKESKREIFCNMHEYASIKATCGGFKVLIDSGLDKGMVYALWPNGARRWFTAKRVTYVFEPVESPYKGR